MNTQENKEQMIEHYLLGQFSLLELAAIESKIKNDSAFAHEVAFQRDIMIGIGESKNLELKSSLQSLKPAGILIRLHVDGSMIKTYAVAASILLLVTLGVLYPQIRDASISNSKKTFSLSK